MADFSTIKTAIIAKLNAQTSYFGTAGDQVYGYEPEVENVIKDPFAVVIPSGNENDYNSSTENRRMYAYTVRIFVQRDGRAAAAEALLTDMVAALIDAFDQDYTLGGTVLYLTAAPSAWGYLQREKEYRSAEIKLVAKTDFSVV